MSNSTATDGSDTLQEMLPELYSAQTFVRVDFASTALLAYDYFLTFSAERQHIWRAKKTVVFYMFISLRYSVLLAWAFECLLDALPKPTAAVRPFSSPLLLLLVMRDKLSADVNLQGCAAVLDLSTIFSAVSLTANCGIFVLRSYAIWNRNKSVLAGVALVALANIVTAILPFFDDPSYVTDDPVSRFVSCLGDGGSLYTKVFTGNLIIGVVFDTLVLVLTVIKTVQQVIHCRKMGIPPMLSYYFLRDGLLYYLAREVLLLAALVLSFMPSQTFLFDLVTGIENAVASILAQRLLLNLKQIEEDRDASSGPTGQMSTLSFAHGSIIGNIGAPLRREDEGDADADTDADADDDNNADIVSEEPRAGMQCPLDIEEVRRE